MKLIRQPSNSNCCGQACVATVCGVSLERAIEVFGTKGKTNTKKVHDALFKLHHCRPHRYLTRIRNGQIDNWVRTAIVKFKAGKLSHWVVWHEGKYYDPGAGVFREAPKYLAEAGAKATSYLCVEKAEAAK